MNTSDLFSVIYAFHVREGQLPSFMEAWEGLTKLIYEYEGSLGSRLHKVNAHLYVAYAQWPDKFTFDNAGNHLPETAQIYRQQMREACTTIEKVYELVQVEKDLIQPTLHPNYKKT